MDALGSTSCKSLCCSTWCSPTSLPPTADQVAGLPISSPSLMRGRETTSALNESQGCCRSVDRSASLAQGSTPLSVERPAHALCAQAALEEPVRDWLGFRNEFQPLRVTFNSETLKGVEPSDGPGPGPEILIYSSSGVPRPEQCACFTLSECGLCAGQASAAPAPMPGANLTILFPSLTSGLTQLVSTVRAWSSVKVWSAAGG